MPTRQETIEFLLDHYEHPRNRGRLDPADVAMKGGNPGCGDVVTLTMRLDPQTRQVRAVRFEGEGCTISQASASILTEMLVGKSVTEVQSLDSEDLIEILGREVVQSRLRCATLALHTAKAAVRKYQHQALNERGGAERDAGQILGLEFE